MIVCSIKTDDHEKITDKSPASDSLKIHLLNHEVQLTGKISSNPLAASSHLQQNISASYLVSSPAQPYLPIEILEVPCLSQHRTIDWMFVRNVLWELEISINQPDPSDRIKIFQHGQNFTFSQSADVW